MDASHFTNLDRVSQVVAFARVFSYENAVSDSQNGSKTVRHSSHYEAEEQGGRVGFGAATTPQ